MQALLLPLRAGVPHYRFSVELDGADYGITLRHNERDGYWYLSLATGAGEPILSGSRVVLGLPLLRNVVSPLRPPGELVATDTSSRGLLPGLDDFGTRVLLAYVERAA